jgi:hypothetical protein
MNQDGGKTSLARRMTVSKGSSVLHGLVVQSWRLRLDWAVAMATAVQSRRCRWTFLAAFGFWIGTLHAQGLGGAVEAFPAGQAASGVLLPLDVQSGRALGGAMGGGDGPGTTVAGVPAASEPAAQIDRAFGSAEPGSPALGHATQVIEASKLSTSPLGRSPAAVIVFPGFTPSRGGGAIEGASNLFTVAPGTERPSIPQSEALR